MFLPEGGVVYTALLYIGTSFGIIQKLLFGEGVSTQPYSISYSITLWLKKKEQPFYFILHIIDNFTLFLSLVRCCIGYISVLAWQAAEAAAGSPAQAS